MTMFVTQNMARQSVVQFLLFPSVRLKNNSIEFWRLFRARAPPEQEMLKTGPIWLDLALKT